MAVRQQWRQPAGILTALLRAAGDFLYPPGCPLCRRPHLPGGLSPSSPLSSYALCAPCRENLCPQRREWCSRCGAEVGPHLGSGPDCPHCRGERFPFEFVLAVGNYAGLLKSICRRIKRRRDARLAAGCAELLWELHGRRLASEKFDAVLSVPRHWSRRWWRAYHPAEVLARQLSRRLNVPLAKGLLRQVRRLPRQSQLPPAQRRKNMRGAFAVGLPPERLRQRQRLLLVDDVLTTGATAREAAGVLKTAGIQRVVVVVLARGIGE